ncbi:restriction endonuclease subunit S [Varibaculum cambriense]|uniref:restriction endonuclease subunit S n=1 Tax=Varibaculum cambriense TaxID=184870 RepID=UPI00241CF1A1|nr:restriction endonuclease subunit S [Varibaculum cambriense]MBS5944573.1 restriction endonuclease subunit S [Varibaculum cambriense]
MSRITDLISHHCPDGVEYYEVSNVLEKVRSKGKLPRSKYEESGLIEVIDQGQDLIAAYCSDLSIANPPEKWILFGDHTRTVKWWEGSFVQGADGLVPLQVKIPGNPKFYYYAMKNLDITNRGYNRHWSVVKDMKLPVPPLEVQDEIVRILDSFTQLETDLESELEAELEARRKQYQYCKDKLLSFYGDVPVLPLCDIADIGTGSSNTNEAIDSGKYPFFVRSQEPLRKNDYDFDETAIITAGDGVGVGKVYHYVDGKYALHQRAYRIHINTPSVCPKFFFHYMKSAFLPYIEKTMYHGSVPSIRRPMLNRFPVPVPPLSEQERIVAILDKFDALVNDLSSGLPAEIAARRKQYEYYRDQLLSFTPAK